MLLTFEDRVSQFREFLEKNSYPQSLTWIEPHDLLLSGRRRIYVRVPPTTNEERARQLFNLSQTSQKGILFGTVCATGDTTYASASVPRNDDEAQRSLIGVEFKMSAQTDRVPCKAVQNRFAWAYLRWAPGRNQKDRNHLFC